MLGHRVLYQLGFRDASHIFSRNASSASSRFSGLDLNPPLELFHLTQLFKDDKTDKKANLSIGAYKTDEGKPWVLPVVKKAELLMVNDKKLDHEYLPVGGLQAFTDAATKLMLSECHPAVKDGRALGIQCLGGTGCLRIAAELLSNVLCIKTFYVTKPTWVNHTGIFMAAGFSHKRELTYYDDKNSTLKMAEYLSEMEKAEENSAIIFHSCAHNPTGMDPSQECWKRIAEIVRQRKLFPVFDTAYHGFATGDVIADGWPIRYFAEQGIELIVCQSFSKTFGLYGERIGNLIFVVSDKAVLPKIKSQILTIIRVMYSNPPAHGARIVATVLNNKELYAEWEQNLCTMATKIKRSRAELRQHLEKLNTSKSWDFLTDQVGLFSLTGLNKTQCAHMVKQHHVYMPKDGRINIAAISPKNVEHVAKAIDDTLKNVK